MPGILPMKIIKAGSNTTQSRIAQACDRCRSKKIRCDGVRPCCSQCANVGFECKTSDKLSRRAFPRGYTESLEERVRSLEGEVRELKDLLDEKEEKIDLLSKVRSNSIFSQTQNQIPCSEKQSLSIPPPSLSSAKGTESGSDSSKHGIDCARSTSSSLASSSPRSNYSGGSSITGLVEIFQRKVRESGKQCPDVKPESFYASLPRLATLSSETPRAMRVPPRLVADHLINVYFQEWALLFPIVHRPSVIKLYESFMSDPDSIGIQHQTLLQLMFAVAAVSNQAKFPQETEILNQRWETGLENISRDCSLLLQYKSRGIALSNQLGLHIDPSSGPLDALSTETRKKVFWSLYTVDCFSAATLGLPRSLNGEKIHVRYPVDIDDEYVTEDGFLPNPPGESSKTSSAIALFKLARILAQILDTVYLDAGSREVTLDHLDHLQGTLETWISGLANHLRLLFVQDKPSTKVISSPSLILSLAYNYVRTLVNRPAIDSRSRTLSSPSVMAMADSCKRMVQIVQLLEERNMSFALCMNRNDMLIISGFGLLFQALDLAKESKMLRDDQKLIAVIISLLGSSNRGVATDFGRLASTVACSLRVPNIKKASKPRSRACESANAPAPMSSPAAYGPKSATSRLQSIASKLTLSDRAIASTKNDDSAGGLPKHHANTVPKDHHGPRSNYRSITSAQSDTAVPSLGRLTVSPKDKHEKQGEISVPNLDYLPFDSGRAKGNPGSLTRTDWKGQNIDWDRFLASMEGSKLATVRKPSTGSTSNSFLTYSPSSESPNPPTWTPGAYTASAALRPPTYSLSSDSLTSGDDLSSCDLALPVNDPYGGMLMPNLVDDEGFALDELSGDFGF
ncbi:MAG: hypothetical protein M1825_002215 [Sarcosagium campestre]|nr:MAG: hypothetical protein M1825_002215 [Sarcosagium campestre]